MGFLYTSKYMLRKSGRKEAAHNGEVTWEVYVVRVVKCKYCCRMIAETTDRQSVQ